MKEEWIRLGESSPKMPIFVSYFTDPFYQKEAFDLARTLQLWKLDYRIVMVTNLGTWECNTNHKPWFLAEMSKAHSNRAICWLDADARMRRYPRLLEDLRYDLAFHYWRGELGRSGALSGTVYLREGMQRDTFLTAWQEQVKLQPTATDQVCMEEAMRLNGIQRVELPVEYAWIYDLAQHSNSGSPEYDCEPVIEHMQASRWRKRMRGLPS